MDIQALKELAAKVEAKTVEWGDLSKALHKSLPDFSDSLQCAYWAQDAFRGDLNAAKALHNAVLPGWDYVLGYTNSGLTIHAQVGPLDEVFSDNPARAWLLAILRALIAEQEGK